ncbi:LysR substrate-binding domain-containing protein [Novosphingobium sp.]|uniref:LysR family transcriptional regulator n=1 Tax=Novosphingobium sp. TaxID=1874826 RepID=UPI003B518FD5
MTLEQLRIFIAVAERENMTRAAEAVHITQSAVSGAIAALEAAHDVHLFHRVGRRIELTDAGRMFLGEARGIMARVESARAALSDWAGLRRGRLVIAASQTIAAYWLPERLARFRRRYPDIDLDLAIANTGGTARAVLAGEAELGFVEGALDDPALAQWPIGTDRMVLVGPPGVAGTDPVTNAWLAQTDWIMRERGSGTRSSFEAAMRDRGLDPDAFAVALTLPSNEAVLSAVRAGAGYAVLSRLVVAPALHSGSISAPACDLPARPFFAMRHKERYRGKAAEALLDVIASYEESVDWVI